MPNVRIALVQETSNHVYYSGSAITGNLLLDTDEPKNYKQISVHFNGKSYVHWTETRTEGSGDNQRTVTDSFTSSESYVDLIGTVWSSQQSSDGKLAPGQYSWPFRFNIPATAPSSFEGTVGHIRYNLIGRIGAGLLKLVEVQIPVQQLVRITDPRLLQPQRKEIQKTVCCMCCASQPIILTVAVPKTGFCIGESFQLHVSLENGSARRVFMMVNLTRKVTFFAEGNRTWRTKILLSIQSDRIEAHGIRNWDPTIEIPFLLCMIIIAATLKLPILSLFIVEYPVLSTSLLSFHFNLGIVERKCLDILNRKLHLNLLESILPHSLPLSSSQLHHTLYLVLCLDNHQHTNFHHLVLQ